MKVLLDQDGYFTGEYAEVGGLEGGVEVGRLPPADDLRKALCHQLEGGRWVYDVGRHQAICARDGAERISALKAQMVAESKSKLSACLSQMKLESGCHGGVYKMYSITSEKQQHLATMIMTAQAAQMSGLDYQPSWNAAGEECTYDWTLGELQQLAIEMEAVVRPLVSRQQRMEAQIMQAETLDELGQMDISFGGEV